MVLLAEMGPVGEEELLCGKVESESPFGLVNWGHPLLSPM